MRLDLPTTNAYSSVLQWSSAVAAQEEHWSDQSIISIMAARLIGELDTVSGEVGFWYEELVRQQTVEAGGLIGQTVRTPGAGARDGPSVRDPPSLVHCYACWEL